MADKTTPATLKGALAKTPVVKTADINFAAFLKLSRVPFIRTVREEGRVKFEFERIEGFDDLQRCWFNRTGKGVLADYADELRQCKGLVHQHRDQ
jgi:hypothetical protein